MAKVLVTEAYLQNIANAIRQKNGSETVYTPGQMAAAIRAIPTGGGGDDGMFPETVGLYYHGNLGTVTFTKKGYYAILAVIDGRNSSVISYSLSGATLVQIETDHYDSSVYATDALSAIVQANVGDSITLSGANISRQVLIVLFLTDKVKQVSSITLSIAKDNTVSETVSAISKKYLFYIIGTTGDNKYSATITSNNDVMFEGQLSGRIHKYGALTGSEASAFEVTGTSYASNYIMLFEVSDEQ